MKLDKSKKVDPKKIDLQSETWGMVKSVATNEKSNNGRMLYIAKNTFKMFEDGILDFSNYFDKGENDISARKMFFSGDDRNTLIAKDFGKFTNQVLVPAMGQNLADIQVKSPYEYRVLTEVSPLIMFMICNAEIYKNVRNEIYKQLSKKIFNKLNCYKANIFLVKGLK